MVATKYSATLTGNPFLLFETREVARLMRVERDPKKLMQEIIESNLFQYKNTKSIPKRFNAIYKRINSLDDSILDSLANGSVLEAKIVNLLTISQEDRLFREFLAEIVCERIHSHDPKLNEKDFDRFFEYKRETIPEVEKWTEKTIRKLIQVYIQILNHSGLIDDRNNKVLQKTFVSDEFKQKLKRTFQPELVNCIVG